MHVYVLAQYKNWGRQPKKNIARDGYFYLCVFLMALLVAQATPFKNTQVEITHKPCADSRCRFYYTPKIGHGNPKKFARFAQWCFYWLCCFVVSLALNPNIGHDQTFLAKRNGIHLSLSYHLSLLMNVLFISLPKYWEFKKSRAVVSFYCLGGVGYADCAT